MLANQLKFSLGHIDPDNLVYICVCMNVMHQQKCKSKKKKKPRKSIAMTTVVTKYCQKTLSIVFQFLLQQIYHENIG